MPGIGCAGLSRSKPCQYTVTLCKALLGLEPIACPLLGLQVRHDVSQLSSMQAIEWLVQTSVHCRSHMLRQRSTPLQNPARLKHYMIATVVLPELELLLKTCQAG